MQALSFACHELSELGIVMLHLQPYASKQNMHWQMEQGMLIGPLKTNTY